MDKKDYKLAYDYIYNLLNLDEESMKWPLTIDSMSIFKELVDEKLNNPTLEQVRKEWEELGYEWEEDSLSISITKYNALNKPSRVITLYKHNKEYDCTRSSMWRVSCLTLQEHQLLTKTFKALGWFDERS